MVGGSFPITTTTTKTTIRVRQEVRVNVIWRILDRLRSRGGSLFREYGQGKKTTPILLLFPTFPGPPLSLLVHFAPASAVEGLPYNY